MNIEWITGVGYGDFVTGLGYAHSCRVKYDRPINIKFHWNHSKDYLFSPNDPETIYDRCLYVQSIMKHVNDLTIHHEFDSNPSFRFYNQLEEFNPLHGLWYSTLSPKQTDRNVVIWTTEHNITFPGKHKDPAYKHWEAIRIKLESEKYKIYEITYRTTVKDAIAMINECEFGIGYDGLAHQLFKFMWKPLIVFCDRFWLNNVLIPQAVLENDPNRFLLSDTKRYVEASKIKVEMVRKQHHEYLNDKQNPEQHKLFNTFIYRQGCN